MITGSAPRLIERDGRALGSPLRLTFAGCEADADRAWDLVEQVFAGVDAAMSRFRDDSALTRLCRASPNGLEDVPRVLVRALVVADRATRMTNGSFDPRIVSALERIGYTGVPQGPTGTAPGQPRSATGRLVARTGRHGSIALPAPVDLGGIGKGLALRWAAGAIERMFRDDRESVLGYLLDAGGDIVTDGAPSPGEAWAIGVGDPTGGTAPIAVLRQAGRGAVATSSISRLRWEVEGRTVHHLIDPKTGEPGGAGLVAVTVAAPDPAWAEVWSKAMFLEGSRAIADTARRRDLAAWWSTTDGRFEMTPAARQRTTWVASEA